jgi:phage baseplate assembly protein gpV
MEDLPWATVMMPNTSSSISGVGSNHGLVNGSWVIGFFRDGLSAQDPIIMGTIASTYEEKPSVDKGFSDSTGEYPLLQHEEEQYIDTNTLVRGVDDPTRLEPDEIIAEPASPYAAEYPFNHVTQTESGHIIELDDTEAAERIRIKHKSGTVIEIFPSGDVVSRTVGSKYTVVAKNDSIHILENELIFVDGNSDSTVGGNDTIHIVGNSKINVDGTANITVAGTTTVKTPTTNWTGNINLSGDLNITGTSTASGDHVSAGISGKGHTHTGDSGGSTSGPR